MNPHPAGAVRMALIVGMGLLAVCALAACDSGSPVAANPTSTVVIAAPATVAAPTETALPPTIAATVTAAPAPETPTPAGVALSTSTPAVPAVANIQEVDFDFVPKVITVPVGTKVTWTNIGPTEHTVADSTLKLFSSSILNKGDTFSYTPTQPGTIHYLCTLHPDMVGTIVVVK